MLLGVHSFSKSVSSTYCVQALFWAFGLIQGREQIGILPSRASVRVGGSAGNAGRHSRYGRCDVLTASSRYGCILPYSSEDGGPQDQLKK